MSDGRSTFAKLIAWLRNVGNSRKLRIIGIITILFFVIFSVSGFFILPPYVKKVATAKLSEQLGRQVSIEAVKLNPYTLEATISGFEIKEADGHTPFVSFGSLYAVSYTHLTLPTN